ncbi:unnamed protein product, partial [Iphiclides podalirius]
MISPPSRAPAPPPPPPPPLRLGRMPILINGKIDPRLDTIIVKTVAMEKGIESEFNRLYAVAKIKQKTVYLKETRERVIVRTAGGPAAMMDDSQSSDRSWLFNYRGRSGAELEASELSLRFRSDT